MEIDINRIILTVLKEYKKKKKHYIKIIFNTKYYRAQKKRKINPRNSCDLWPSTSANIEKKKRQ